MLARLLSWITRLRTWLLVRLGLWRGEWRRGQVQVRDARPFPFANSKWSYGLYCPRGLDDATPAPLVLLLHGCQQRALSFAQASGFARAARLARFRLLCPEQRRRANLWRCWNWFTPAAQRGQGELLVMRAMLAQVRQQVGVAEGSVAAVGLSAGAGLAALLAFHAADCVQAAVAVAAPPLLGRANTQDPREVMKSGLQIEPALALTGTAPVAPLMIVQGRADEVVAPVCAEQLLAQAVKGNERSNRALLAQPTASSLGTSVTDYRDADGLRLRMVWIDSLNHAWTGAPGGHAFVERRGERLTETAVSFLREVLRF